MPSSEFPYKEDGSVVEVGAVDFDWCRFYGERFFGDSINVWGANWLLWFNMKWEISGFWRVGLINIGYEPVSLEPALVLYFLEST